MMVEPIRIRFERALMILYVGMSFKLRVDRRIYQLYPRALSHESTFSAALPQSSLEVGSLHSILSITGAMCLKSQWRKIV
jgi:hypothetical protein